MLDSGLGVTAMSLCEYYNAMGAALTRRAAECLKRVREEVAGATAHLAEILFDKRDSLEEHSNACIVPLAILPPNFISRLQVRE